MENSNKTHNVNIANMTSLMSPNELKAEFKASSDHVEFIYNSRQAVQDVLDKKDNRRVFVVGPCSIHNMDSAIEYAEKLKVLSDKFSDKMVLVMRTYFEKPRTRTGWKGLINDPDMDDSKDLQKGIRLARKLLVQITDIGLPTATEMLDTITPQYLSDLVTYASIGARTSESQPHREMASGLSMPVGFKNTTDGSLSVALNGMASALSSHSFIGTDQDAKLNVVDTTGNQYVHLILRGGHRGPNYDAASIRGAVAQLEASDFNTSLVVDCSHGNSEKKYKNQEKVLKSLIKQIQEGDQHIRGIMLESNLKSGNQSIPKDLSQLVYGQSVTDECLDWEMTEDLLHYAYSSL